jgi:hypothetical protein
MDVEAGSIFLTMSILLTLGFIVIGLGIVFLNNVFVRYWKPMTWFKFVEYPPGTGPRYEEATPEELKRAKAPAATKKRKTPVELDPRHR